MQRKSPGSLQPKHPINAHAGGRTHGRVLALWFGCMALTGIAFGLLGDRRPFGQDVFAHPLMMLFVAATLAVLALRMLIARPVSELIPDRMLLLGCFTALVAFLVGNFLSARFLPV